MTTSPTACIVAGVALCTNESRASATSTEQLVSKVLAAQLPLPAVGVKLDKAKLLARLAPLQVLLGVMVCPIILSLEARIERLHDAVGGNLYVGERQPSRDGQWQWCFACASIS